MLRANGDRRIQVVETEQSAVRDQHHLLDRKALEHMRKHGLYRFGLTDVAWRDRVQQRQTTAALHHAQHELTRHLAGVLAQAFAHQRPVSNRFFAPVANRGQVMEDHRKCAVQQRPNLPAHGSLHRAQVLDQRIHRA